ncbi:MAG: prepilin-type N-terminal cleavage/methylation domain-containing protein [Myxococcota bacterium]
MRRGFSLLEVMVALSILALALVAISGGNAIAFESSNYARYVTVATLLARGKMLDVEEKLRKDGFGDTDKEYDGDFETEGYPTVKWNAVCRPVEVDVNQLLGGLFGSEAVGTDKLPEQIKDFMGALNGSGDKKAVDSIAGSDLSKVLGGGGLEMILKQVGDTLSKSIREITLEVTWKDGQYKETLRFVEYVTTSGRLAVPNANFQIPAGTAVGPDGQPLPPGANGIPGIPGIGGGINGGFPGGVVPGHRNVNTSGTPFIGGIPVTKGVTK